jgi:hypothetical protein
VPLDALAGDIKLQTTLFYHDVTIGDVGDLGEAVEFVDEYVRRDGTFDLSAEAFAGVLVDDGHDLDRAASVVASN